MQKFVLLFVCMVVLANADSLEDYYHLIQKYPELVSEPGDHTRGEIEIVLDRKRIQEIETFQKNKLLKKGYSETYSSKSTKVGLIAEDLFWLFIRDAVIFPSGHVGTYNRLLLKSSLQKNKEPGVAVLPYLEDGRVVLILHYRHATRSWELEIPRGIKEMDETLAEAAKRETFEETGCKIDQLTLLGTLIADSGLVNAKIPIFSAKIKEIKEAQIESSEAIFQSIIFDKRQIEEGLSKGYIEITFQGEKRCVSMQDSYLAYAVLQMILKGKW